MADVLPDPQTEFGRRLRRRLREEYVAWLTTTGRDGTPQPNPVWFIWEEPDAVVVYSRADAHRLAHIERTGRATLHLNSSTSGGDVVVLSGRAELMEGAPPPHEHPDYLRKYDDGMRRVSGSAEAFSQEYPVPVVIRVERVRGF